MFLSSNSRLKRAACVQVEGVDLDGKPLRIKLDGLLARVLQHEIDHLNGTTLLDHAFHAEKGPLPKAAQEDGPGGISETPGRLHGISSFAVATLRGLNAEIFW